MSIHTQFWTVKHFSIVEKIMTRIHSSKNPIPLALSLTRSMKNKYLFVRIFRLKLQIIPRNGQPGFLQEGWNNWNRLRIGVFQSSNKSSTCWFTPLEFFPNCGFFFSKFFKFVNGTGWCVIATITFVFCTIPNCVILLSQWRKNHFAIS